MLPLLSTFEVRSLLAAHQNAVLLFDAEWNLTGKQQLHAALARLAGQHRGQLIVGTVDVDTDTDLARAADVVNVPSIAYYRRGLRIKTVTGLHQNVEELTDPLKPVPPVQSARRPPP